ncbi:MAG TPA: tyrosinase family protein [Bryobacteraceae bacterium]|nr:tyrosinase family protein [Bryobacteraceae bacterium]
MGTALAARAADRPPACGFPAAIPRNPLTKPPDAVGAVPFPAGSPKARPLWSRLSPWDQAQLARKLREAYGKMAGRAASDTRGLLYQAWQHAVNCGAGVDYPDVHSNEDFLPWHRAFLFVHEWMLQAELQDPDFRVPVWDWENDPEVPWAYQFLPGIKGPCYAPRLDRLPTITDGAMRDWLISGSFDEFVGGKAAGGVHAFVHGNLGDTSYMADPSSAAADPLFYAHHANVDRYWFYWWQHYQNQFPAHWPDKNFSFYGADSLALRIRMADLMDPAKLGYSYDPPGEDYFKSFTPVDAVPAPSAPADRSALTFQPDAWSKVTDYLDQLLGLDVRSLLNLVRAEARDIFSLVKNFSAFRDLDLPVYATARLSNLERGRYHLVELRALRSNARQVIGGFGVFMGDHGMPGMAAEVNPLLTLDWSALAAIAQSLPFGFHLVYGPQGNDRQIEGPPRAFPVSAFQLRLLS